MTGHHPFKKLTGSFSEARQARVATGVSELKAEMALDQPRHPRDRSQEEEISRKGKREGS